MSSTAKSNCAKNFDMILPGERQSNSGWAEFLAFWLAALSVRPEKA